ncbi:MAG: hypothetical protein AB1716_10410 [Planctomycetota bacterium]
MTTDRPAHLATPPLDRDLFCLKCAYNLRGLSGDPVRCPECGNLNPLGDAEIPAAMVSARLRRMETAPCVCVALVLASVPPAIPLSVLILAALSEPPGDWVGWLCCFGIAETILLSAWSASVAAFRRSCGGKPGWLGLLALYHALGIGAAVSIFVLPLGVGHFANRPRTGAGLAALVVIGALLTLVLGVLLVGRLHRLLRERMEALQREVAVELLREESRRRAGRTPHGRPS